MKVPVINFLHRVDVYTEQNRTEVAHEAYFLAIANAGDDDAEVQCVSNPRPTGVILDREPIEEFRRFQRRYGKAKVRDVFGRFADGKLTAVMAQEAKRFTPKAKPKTAPKAKSSADDEKAAA
jgi:hypothetical protein